MKAPVLYHIEISHYNEKARWALDFKGVPHARRAPIPLLHTAWAYAMTRNKTFPVLRIDGDTIGDSTKIIAELERRYPEPPLYPADADDRRRALDLEDFFDEELGPHIRVALFHELTKDPEKFSHAVAPQATGAKRAFFRTGAPLATRATRLRYGISDESARLGREKTVAAMDRLAAEIGPSGYLVGDRFSVADLTGAALLYPVVMPAQMPYRSPMDPPESAQRFLEPLRSHPAYDWVARMYAEHRGVWVPAT